jgi:putative endonuclease
MGIERRQAWRRGRRAEGLAILALSLAGYRILARNLKSPLGEIDIVARRGRTIAFIEVKNRADWNGAAEALSGRQRRRIGRAAAGFLAARPELAGHQARFDVVLTVPWRWPRHRCLSPGRMYLKCYTITGMALPAPEGQS